MEETDLLVASSRLTSFVLGVTFDTLPAPTKLKRWHIITEADCSLCSVKVCTTAHVFSGCKVALSQGRYTFRHDSILRVLHNSFSKLLSSTSPVRACPSLSSCFVKHGKIFYSSKKKPHIGTFHESSDRKLSVDFDSSLAFPSFIAITASRPDIVIYSVLKKTVILIELTSPCEENFEDRHFNKIGRYAALCVSVRENGWHHHLFAIEVGARGYFVYNVRSCFRRLGLNTKGTKVVLSELTSTAIQCSFVIWINRDKEIWNEKATSTFDIPHKAPRKHTTFKNKDKDKVSKHSNSKFSQPLSKFYRPGFINKGNGNTCYMNALLQALSVLTGFWSTIPALALE